MTQESPPNALEQIDPGRAARERQALRDLLELRKLLEDPTKWVQHVQAEADVTGIDPVTQQPVTAHVQCAARNPQAVRWCLTGGCILITDYTPGKPTDRTTMLRYSTLRAHLYDTLRRMGIDYDSLVHFNDNVTHGEVVGLIDLTIQELASTYPDVVSAVRQAITDTVTEQSAQEPGA